MEMQPIHVSACSLCNGKLACSGLNLGGYEAEQACIARNSPDWKALRLVRRLFITFAITGNENWGSKSAPFPSIRVDGVVMQPVGVGEYLYFHSISIFAEPHSLIPRFRITELRRLPSN